MPITQVKEINRLAAITKLPKTPDFVEGVINLRGTVIPVIDLKKRFGFVTGAQDENDSRIIVIDIDGHTVGVVVDEVNEVLRLPEKDIEPPPTFIGGVDAEFLTGVGKVDDRLLVLLDLGRVLSGREKAELVEIAKS